MNTSCRLRQSLPSAFRLLHSTLAALLLLPCLLMAQTSAVPNRISYQGIVTDGGGNLVGDSSPENHEVIFRLWDHPTASAAGNLVYSEKQVVTIGKGKFSVLIGAGADVTGEESKGPGTLDVSDVFTGNQRFLGVTVAAAASPAVVTGSDVEISPRQQMVSSAFTFRAKEAETVVDGSISTDALADGSITLAKLGSGAVNSTTIVNSSITASDLANNAVTLAKLAANAVDSGKIVDASIATADLADGAITAAKLGSDVGLWSVNGGNLYRDSGHVAIGFGSRASNPTVPLYVLENDNRLPHSSGTDTVGTALRIGGNSPTVLDFGQDAANGAWMQARSENNHATQHKLLINPNGGNVGIGTTNPNFPLHVRAPGTFDVMKLEVNNGKYWTLNINGGNGVLELRSNNQAGTIATISPTSGAYTAVSDRRLKAKITRLEPVLDQVMELIPSSYWFKASMDAALPSLGFIAQDVEELFPEVVHETAAGTKGIEYTAMVPIAFKAIQELKDRQDSMTRSLEAENSALKKRLAELEAKDKARDAKLVAIEALLKSMAKPPVQTASLEVGAE